MPGSRRSEVGRLAPVFGEVLAQLSARVPGLQAVLPTVAHVAPAFRDDDFIQIHGITKTYGIVEALKDVNVAYYFIHSLYGGSDFHSKDMEAARNFGAAAKASGRDLNVASFDLSANFLQSIVDGDAAFAIDQQQYLQGYLPVILMFLQATNQNTAGGGLPVLTGPGFVTPDNATAVKALVDAGTR